MDKTGKFLLPSPKFTKLDAVQSKSRHFLSPQGIQLLPSDQQPPPMYGPRGSTVPPKFHSPLKVPTTNDQFDRKQKYFCEPCEAEFHTSTDYKVHKSEHVQCEIDNCKFRGHPAFMDTHIGQQHATGLYEQLKNLNTPEEIAQWRADRKKNFPTVASVEQKWKAREQRMKRGEKLEMQNKNRFGKHSDRRQMNGGDKANQSTGKESKKKQMRKKQRDRKFDKKKIQDTSKASPKDEKVSVEVKDEGETCSHGLRVFKGTGGMEDYKKARKVETNVLSSLLGMYGSDSEDDSQSEEEESQKPSENTMTESKCTTPVETDEEESGIEHAEPEIEEKPVERQSSDDEGPEELSIEKISNIPDNSELKSPSQEASSESIAEKALDAKSSDDEGPEEAAISKTTHIPDKPQSEPPHKKIKPNPLKRKSLLDYRKLRLGRQNTMLEKLLEPDIRHERNVLLQCVRFVVENNFFDKPEKT